MPQFSISVRHGKDNLPVPSNKVDSCEMIVCGHRQRCSAPWILLLTTRSRKSRKPILEMSTPSIVMEPAVGSVMRNKLNASAGAPRQPTCCVSWDNLRPTGLAASRATNDSHFLALLDVQIYAIQCKRQVRSVFDGQVLDVDLAFSRPMGGRTILFDDHRRLLRSIQQTRKERVSICAADVLPILLVYTFDGYGNLSQIRPPWAWIGHTQLMSNSSLAYDQTVWCSALTNCWDSTIAKAAEPCETPPFRAKSCTARTASAPTKSNRRER